MEVLLLSSYMIFFCPVASVWGILLGSPGIHQIREPLRVWAGGGCEEERGYKKPRRIGSSGSPKKREGTGGHHTHKESLHAPEAVLGTWGRLAGKWCLCSHMTCPGLPRPPTWPGRPRQQSSAEPAMVGLCLLRAGLVVWFCKSKALMYSPLPTVSLYIVVSVGPPHW